MDAQMDARCVEIFKANNSGDSGVVKVYDSLHEVLCRFHGLAVVKDRGKEEECCGLGCVPDISFRSHAGIVFVPSLKTLATSLAGSRSFGLVLYR